MLVNHSFIRLVIAGSVFSCCLVSLFIVGRVSHGVELDLLQDYTKELCKRGDDIERSLAKLILQINELGEHVEEGAVVSAKDRIYDAVDLLETAIEGETDVLENGENQNFEQLEFEIQSLGPGCRSDSAKGSNTPVPRHPIGGGDPDESLQQAGIPDRVVDTSNHRDTEFSLPSCNGDASEKAACQREAVKEAFTYSWEAYKEHAWGHDELKPISKTYKDWGPTGEGLGLTILDSVSTIWIMGLKDEFERVREWVKNDMKVSIPVRVSQFETTIRLVGGLLSAYELSGEKHKEFLEKAVELADILLYAYQTPNGVPSALINLQTKQHSNPGWTANSAILSEFGSTQLEFRTLTYHTGISAYDEAVTWVVDLYEAKAPRNGLFPTYFKSETSSWSSDHITLGALGDSFYEYLLKQYLLTEKTEKRYRKMYERAIAGIVGKLLKKSQEGDMYLAEWKRDSVYNKMDHLACFASGMFALGSVELGDPELSDGISAEDMLTYAESLSDTCYKMYTSQATGISPEIVLFQGGQNMVNSRTNYYLLRPEVLESFMYLHIITGKQVYRDRSWTLFSSITKYCRVDEGGFSGIRDVTTTDTPMDDLQQSFWMAETLKYLYFTFSDELPIDLKEWVLNTEGHPLRRRKRDPLDSWPDEAVQKRKKSLNKPIADRINERRAEHQKFVQRGQHLKEHSLSDVHKKTNSDEQSDDTEGSKQTEQAEDMESEEDAELSRLKRLRAKASKKKKKKKKSHTDDDN
eukprot:TRINITY_DN4577_c0_g1_i2.p1 TRINITY_DN4577_c0_g1~~TRINITY_DN4577_c0_g1_i2.p1  ORF type:complete len:750 (+),score=148.98 TRINITY_DN4577_c0_g1_i2:45-2294(+)